MKKAPLLILIIISSCFFSLFGFAGRNDIYYNQDHNLLKAPFFTGMFIGINNDMYPWMLYDDDIRSEAKLIADQKKEKEAKMLALMEEEKAKEEASEEVSEAGTPTIEPTMAPKVVSTPTPTPEPTYTPRYAPLRDSTYEEYSSHISADIYGDEGELFALSYDGYMAVDESYFDNALFIGDSRTVGLRDYTDLTDHAKFLAETSLTIWKTFKTDFNGNGKLEDVLTDHSFDKIYLMVGVNELGTGTTEDFMSEYTKVVDRIIELQPDAIIYIQAIMNVDKEKSTTDSVFNNVNILGRNHAIATLADNKQVFYININESVCDEEGFLRDDLRGDHLHLKASSNKLWKNYLMLHAVVKDEDKSKYKNVDADALIEKKEVASPTPNNESSLDTSNKESKEANIEKNPNKENESLNTEAVNAATDNNENDNTEDSQDSNIE